VSVTALSLANGGYFATEWGWASLGFLLVALTALIVRPDVRVTRASAAFLLALVLFAGWTALSTLWAPTPALPLLETQRVFVYVAAAAAFIAVAPQGEARYGFAAGTTAAVALIAGDALAGHLFPDRATFDPEASFRLAGSFDYSNALGLLAAIGLLLALGYVGHASSAGARALAGASVVLLATTLYLTFSRGSVLAFAVGAVVLVALEPRRLALGLAAAPTAAAALIAVWFASRQTALTTEGYPLDDAARAGHRVALGLAVLMLAGAAAGAFSRLHALVPSRERAFAYALALFAVLLVAVAATQATRAVSAFDRQPSPTGGDLNRRLLSVSSDWRSDYWRVAWRESRDHPLLGGGAGSWQRSWLRDRPADITVRNAHNLYLETLAELGPPGLALLLAALCAPLVAVGAARRRPYGAAAAAAYSAFLVHVGVDWDWQITAIGVTALTCAVPLACSGRALELDTRLRAIVAAPIVLLGALAVCAQIGNSAAASSSSAADRLDLRAARADARKAIRWQPWSAEPWRLLAEAQLTAGNVEAARVSLRRALRRDPTNWELWYVLAAASEGPAQRAALERAARLNPFSPEIAALREAERKV
jgi:O-antigen ligase